MSISHTHSVEKKLALTPLLVMAIAETSKRLQDVEKLAKTKPAEAEAGYKEILNSGPGATEAAAKDYESALLGLGGLYADQKRANDLADLVGTTRSKLSNLPKAKTAKLGGFFFQSPVYPEGEFSS